MGLGFNEIKELLELRDNKTKQYMLSDKVTLLECIMLHKAYDNYLITNGKEPLKLNAELYVPSIIMKEEDYQKQLESIENGEPKYTFEAQNKIKAYEQALIKKIGADNVNAFQHAYGTAYLMSIYGEDVARNIMIERELNSAEYYKIKEGNFKDSYRDLNNNEVGILYQKKYGDLNIVAQKLFEDLLVNSKTGKIEYYYNQELKDWLPSANKDSNLIWNKNDITDDTINVSDFKKELNNHRFWSGDYFLKKEVNSNTLHLLGFGNLNPTLSPLQFLPGGDYLNNLSPVINQFKLKQILDNFNKYTELPEIIHQIQSLFNVSKLYDPLTFDLDGDGIETIALKDSNVFFDLDNDNFDERSGWISKDDGLLIIDKNNNGLVNDINELFGDITKNGFEELKDYDSNFDGKIDSNDADFGEMKIWQDLNENGISEAGELKTLTELGIESINLNYDKVYQLNNGNLITETSTFVLTDGTTRTVSDVNLATNQMESYVSEEIPLSLDILELPMLRGYGVVKNLSQSMMENEGLKTFVENLSESHNITDIYESMDDLLAMWTGNENIDLSEMRGIFSARKLAILESFMGQEYFSKHIGSTVTSPNVVNYDNMVGLESAYNLLKNMQFAHFVIQSMYAEAFGDAYYSLSYDEIIFPDDVSEIMNNIAFIINNSDDYTAGCFSLVLNILHQEQNINLNVLVGQVEQEYFDVITGAKNLVMGSDLNNTLYGRYDDDLVKGYAGNDIIDTAYGNDTLIGGKGDDILRGGSNNDTYIFNRGDGQDTINENVNTLDTAVDRVVFGPNINLADLDFKTSETNLIISFNNTPDQLTILGQFDPTGRFKIEFFEFEDGTVLSENDIISLTQIVGNEFDNVIDGSFTSDTIFAREGNDIVDGFAGDDVINGGSGNDYILAGTGNDTLTDISGSDLYTFSQGDGIDVITDLDSTLEDIDTIDFAEGIDKEDIAVFMDNNDLVIGYGPDDQIVVKNQAEELYGVEMLQLADGDFITAEDINMIVQEMTAFANTEGFAITSVEQVQANPDLMNIVMNGWS